MKNKLDADDQELVRSVEEVMAEDIHEARSQVCLFCSAVSLGHYDKADIYRKRLCAYVARRKLGEKITMKDVIND